MGSVCGIFPLPENLTHMPVGVRIQGLESNTSNVGMNTKKLDNWFSNRHRWLQFAAGRLLRGEPPDIDELVALCKDEAILSSRNYPAPHRVESNNKITSGR